MLLISGVYLCFEFCKIMRPFEASFAHKSLETCACTLAFLLPFWLSDGRKRRAFGEGKNKGELVGFARSMEEIIANNSTTRTPLPPPPPQPQQQVLDNNNSQIRRARPEKEHSINCPRCNSTNTKFCYYNNYSLTQPRYFCKTCRRYWTQGGSLRNVPVGGGSRKNKRCTPSSSSSSISPSSSSAITSLSSIAPTSSPLSSTTTTNHKLFLDLNPPTTTLSHLIPPHKTHPHNHHHHHHHGQDLNLAFPTTRSTQDFHATLLQPIEMPKLEGNLNSYVPVPMPDSNGVLYTSSGFPNLQELKPSLMGFPGPADGLGHRFNIGSLQENNNNNNTSGDGASARLLFPFGDINKFPSHHNNASATNNTSIASDHDQVANQNQSMKGTSQDHHQGYWSGMLGGGTW